MQVHTRPPQAAVSGTSQKYNRVVVYIEKRGVLVPILQIAMGLTAVLSRMQVAREGGKKGRSSKLHRQEHTSLHQISASSFTCRDVILRALNASHGTSRLVCALPLKSLEECDAFSLSKAELYSSRHHAT